MEGREHGVGLREFGVLTEKLNYLKESILWKKERERGRERKRARERERGKGTERGRERGGEKREKESCLFKHDLSVPTRSLRPQLTLAV